MSNERDRRRIRMERGTSPEVLNGKNHVLFVPGFGSQKSGMGRDLATYSTAARLSWQESDQAAFPYLGRNLSDIAWNGTEEELLAHQQALIPADARARIAALAETGQLGNPGGHAGYSLGIYGALINSGAISLEGAAFLMDGKNRVFAEVRDKIPRTKMVMLYDTDIQHHEQMTKLGLRICILGSEKTEDGNVMQTNIFGGLVDDVDHAVSYLEEHGGLYVGEEIIPIDNPAFHSEFMGPAVDLFRGVVDSASIQSPTNGALYGGTTVRELITPADIRRELVLQLIQTERYRDLVRHLRMEKGVVTFTELNNAATLTRLARETLGGSRDDLLLPRNTTPKNIVIARRLSLESLQN